MDERESARAEINDSRERIKEIATQLAQRAKPSYMKERAKEAAVQKSVEIKDRIAGSPVALGIIGGIATAGIAKLLSHPRDHNGNGQTGYALAPDRSAPIDGRNAEAEPGKVEQLKDKAGELTHKAKEQVDKLREHIPTGAEVKTKARELTARAAEEPLITALGALAIGAALGLLLPLTQRERRVLKPAREQISDKLESLSTQVGDKVEEKVGELEEKIAGAKDEDTARRPSDMLFAE
jgi:hypothetical protein